MKNHPQNALEKLFPDPFDQISLFSCIYFVRYSAFCVL